MIASSTVLWDSSSSTQSKKRWTGTFTFACQHTKKRESNHLLVNNAALNSTEMWAQVLGTRWAIINAEILYHLEAHFWDQYLSQDNFSALYAIKHMAQEN